MVLIVELEGGPVDVSFVPSLEELDVARVLQSAAALGVVRALDEQVGAMVRSGTKKWG